MMQVHIPLNPQRFMDCVIQSEIDHQLIHELIGDNTTMPSCDPMESVYLYLPDDQTYWLRDHASHVNLLDAPEHLVLEFDSDSLGVEFLLKFY